MAPASEEIVKFHTVSNEAPFSLLDCRDAFKNLTEREKRYAHHIATASFEGAKICLLQTSRESPIIFSILQRVFAGEQSLEDLKKEALAAGVSETDFRSALMYAATFYSNYGNYRSYGDSKLIPGIAPGAFHAIIRSSTAYSEELEELWGIAVSSMYSLDEKVRSIGLGADGVSTYYSANCTKEDAETVQQFMNEKNINGYNTRIFKTLDASGKIHYELRLAAVEEKELMVHLNPDSDGAWKEIRVVTGDYSPILARVVQHLKLAAENAENETQVAMLNAYIRSFQAGSIDDHKEGSCHWVKDKGPVVESYIGFIESYRDPLNVRGEWEGFAAIVDKETSAKFGSLVESAERMIKMLPWPASFEKDSFLRPDFTALEVLGFGSSGIPAGINIPNYDDIRQSIGFKNVSLANMQRTAMTPPKGDKISFLRDEDQDLYRELLAEAFEVQVGIHELLGHGSGKLFCENEDGSFNFDRDATINPLTGASISSWYKPGETYGSQFPIIGSSYEECRAESVGIFLSVNTEVLGIFNHQGENAKDITYINWLHMARAGVLALEQYTPGKGSAGWGQAHMMARYAILQVLLEAGEGFVEIRRGSESGKETVVVLDRSKIETVGVPAISAFLTKLQVYKATADYEAAKALYEKYTAVPDSIFWLRDEVMSKRKPRRILVQHVTKLQQNDDVTLLSFDESPEGMIQSFRERYPTEDAVLLDVWNKEEQHHRLE